MILKNKLVIYVLSVISMILDLCDCLSFLSPKTSYAEYPAWTASVNGKLEFEFKTYEMQSLLLYVEEIGHFQRYDDRSYLKLELRKGGLYLIVQMGGSDSASKKRKRFGAGLNDLKWHKVVIQRNGIKTVVMIDKWKFDVNNEGGVLSYLPINSSLYIGGVPHSKLGSAVDKGLDKTPRFIGCVRNLAYSVNSESVKADLLSSDGVESGCANACTKSKYVPCANSGKCINEFNTFSCNCKGSGYRGRNCTAASESAYFRGVEYLEFGGTRRLSMVSHHVIIRFKTYLENGILLAVGIVGKDFLILELHKGTLRMAIDLGGGILELFIGNGDLNDRVWHKIELIRKGTLCQLKLDDKYAKNATTPGRNSRFDVQHSETTYYGGHPDARYLQTSKAKQNFSGCMQDVFYNDDDVLEQTFSFRQVKTVEGVQKGCPKFTPPPTTTSAPTVQTTVTKKQDTTRRLEEKTKEIVTPSVVKNGNFQSQNGGKSPKEPLTKSQIAWITSGIIVGALFLVFTTACLVHRCKRRYNGFLISSSLKNKDNQQRPSLRYKGERVVFLEHGTKEKLDKVTNF
eukprot:gene7522-13303_t